MKTTEGMRLILTRTACKNAVRDGFKADDITEAFSHPTRVSPVKSHPGQYKVANDSMVIIGAPSGDRFVGITMHKRG